MLLRPLFLLLIAPALALAGCSAAPSAPPPLQGATMGGSFTLTNQDGRRVTDAALAGKYRLVYFGYTSCPDVCPVDMQVIGAGLRQFEAEDAARAARVQPIFISVDPSRDTPPVLRAFVAHFHPRMIGLTGSEAEIADAARKYRVFYERGEPGAGGGYMVDHTRMVVLYGPAGEPIAMIPHDQGAAGVAAELDRWVR
ncbi:MAG TPA: SCO family protein [Allosphingosinicella sp.]|nr:SCO family protein [Allosphingosinicella sp.]